ncbi:NAD(P)/FAD-dependent oxidoreductase [Dactylosporangium sp. AC04546]|uniref:FAD-dependent oxidoreductase n=1 Tax=Dactylosporangium sp. AC04546 TaxID=2862460 RepID=UPI001EDD1299|nr:NAD(P)/FAD-dependent oxidoreductase [Dactylosporangium sp. AC04546]WVK87688.1 NAD(P)/FAD-dependent oxidoreductase [Dactylosporangium sp. AC04546]
MKAIVIGGGIAGPVAAMALQKSGIESRVFEAYDGTADGVGGALSIAPNGRTALKAIDAEHVVERIGTPMAGMVMQSWTGKRLGEFGSPADLPQMLLVWRAELYRALYDEAVQRGVAFEHGKRLTQIDGGEARFADGTTAAADVIVGADGIRSTTRRLIDPAAPEPRYAGLLGFGARVTKTDGLDDTHDKMHMVFGKRAFFGYQVGRDDAGWFANLPHRAPMSAAEARRVDNAEWLRRIAEVFGDDRVPAVELIRRTDPDDLVVTGGLEDIPRVPTWHRGNVVLIGDAAHPTSPSSGQGASLAIESAVQLARCLRDLPPERAFQQYERIRRERVERIIKMAARTNSDKAAGPVGRVLRDLLMPTLMRFARPSSFAWQFDHPIDWDERVALPT